MQPRCWARRGSCCKCCCRRVPRGCVYRQYRCSSGAEQPHVSSISCCWPHALASCRSTWRQLNRQAIRNARPAAGVALLSALDHCLHAVQVRLPNGEPLDVILALASGPASSGLLGTTSLTYQVGPRRGQSRCN